MYCTICSHFVERSGKGTCAVPALHSLHLAARALFLRRLLRVEHHPRRGARRGGSLRQLARDLVKQVVDIRRRFGRRLHEEESILFGIRGRLLCLHLALLSKIRLVACQRHHQAGVALPLQLAHPALGACERALALDVVHDDCCRRAPVVHRRQRVVPLLPRGVPDLELHRGVIDRHCLRQESCADGRLLVVEELPLHETQNQGGLACAHVAQEHQLRLHGSRSHDSRTSCDLP
mmetsp:Transcript_20875/g.33813  ORF Transcript_20875/g.33813 Transcript_20875/m.33813 type:complete len:234 (+) Transcript_20875:344-1045(+)